MRRLAWAVYERLWLPTVIIVSFLLSTTAVFTALLLTGVELNITALMGMTMIIGIGTEMAIFYVSEYTSGMLVRIAASVVICQGSGIQQSLAIAIIAGLLLQYRLVLLVLPVAIGFTVRKT